MIDVGRRATLYPAPNRANHKSSRNRQSNLALTLMCSTSSVRSRHRDPCERARTSLPRGLPAGTSAFDHQSGAAKYAADAPVRPSCQQASADVERPQRSADERPWPTRGAGPDWDGPLDRGVRAPRDYYVLEEQRVVSDHNRDRECRGRARSCRSTGRCASISRPVEDRRPQPAAHRHRPSGWSGSRGRYRR